MENLKFFFGLLFTIIIFLGYVFISGYVCLEIFDSNVLFIISLIFGIPFVIAFVIEPIVDLLN